MHIAPEIFSLDQYIASVYCPARRETIREILEVVKPTMLGICHTNGISVDIPEIRIVNSATVQAECSTYCLQINEGLINLCLDSYMPAVEEFIPELDGISLDPAFLRKLALSWVIAHEWMHVIKRHNDVIRATVDNQPDVAELVEHDADLCAIAVIYRLIQNAIPSKTDSMIARKIALFSVFWPLSTIPIERQDVDHAPMPLRLYHITTKLAQLTDRFGETPALYDHFEPQLARTRVLLRFLFDLDRPTGHRVRSNELCIQIGEILKSRSHMKFYIGWENICPVVEAISGTTSDITKYRPKGYVAPIFDEELNLVSGNAQIDKYLTKK